MASHIQLFEAEQQLDLLPKMKKKGIIHLRFALQCLAQIRFLRKDWQTTDTGKIILRYSLMTIDQARFLYNVTIAMKIITGQHLQWQNTPTPGTFLINGRE